MTAVHCRCRIRLKSAYNSKVTAIITQPNASAMQWSNICLNKLAAKMVIVCCVRLLLAHSENFVKLTFVVVKIFLVRQFCDPSSVAPGGKCPHWPLSYMPLIFSVTVTSFVPAACTKHNS